MSNTNSTELQLAHMIFFHHQNPSNTWKRSDRKWLLHMPTHKDRILRHHFKKQSKWSHKEWIHYPQTRFTDSTHQPCTQRRLWHSNTANDRKFIRQLVVITSHYKLTLLHENLLNFLPHIHNITFAQTYIKSTHFQKIFYFLSNREMKSNGHKSR